MSLDQAKQILEAAINAGLQKGAYTLSDTAQILQALQLLYTLESQNKEAAE